jgi:SAM-dependent methyltransferase
MSQYKILTDDTGFKWQEEDRPCPVCKSNEYKQKGKRGGAYHRAKKGVTANIVQCKNCTLLYARPTLVPMGNPYETDSDGYFELHNSEWKQNFGEGLADKLEKIIGKKGRIIEPACGLGDFVLGAKKRGWEARGIEMTESFAKLAIEAGLDVEIATVEDSAYMKEKYDAILLIATLEHLYYPLEMMERAYNALNPGGVLIINVPNEITSVYGRFGNMYIKSYGMDWTMSLSPTFSPFHVVGFSPKSLRFALEKIGYNVLELESENGVNGLPVNNLRQRIESVGLSTVYNVAKFFSGEEDAGTEIFCWAQRPKNA